MLRNAKMLKFHQVIKWIVDTRSPTLSPAPHRHRFSSLCVASQDCKRLARGWPVQSERRACWAALVFPIKTCQSYHLLMSPHGWCCLLIENSVADTSERQGRDLGSLAGFLILWGNLFPDFCMVWGKGGTQLLIWPCSLQEATVEATEVINGKPVSVLRNKTGYIVNWQLFLKCEVGSVISCDETWISHIVHVNTRFIVVLP